MKHIISTKAPNNNVANHVRTRIKRGGERLWQVEDFRNKKFSAVAKVLSRLTKDGLIQRLSKGVYYRPKNTIFGPSLPNKTHLHRLAQRKQAFFPAGIVAANKLGFTTQAAIRGEVSTVHASLPRKLMGEQVIIHTRRPAAWEGLSQMDAALLDFMRAGGLHSELSSEDSIKKLMFLLSEGNCLERLLKVSSSEPPRVRALLGATAQLLGASANVIEKLRKSINPLSRFDFGIFSGLPNAHAWQAKEKKPNVTI